MIHDVIQTVVFPAGIPRIAPSSSERLSTFPVVLEDQKAVLILMEHGKSAEYAEDLVADRRAFATLLGYSGPVCWGFYQGVRIIQGLRLELLQDVLIFGIPITEMSLDEQVSGLEECLLALTKESGDCLPRSFCALSLEVLA